MKIVEIFKAIKDGKTVCWNNESYEVHFTDSNGSKYAKFSEVGNKCLRVSCIQNYFGSYISETDLNSCYIVEKTPVY